MIATIIFFICLFVFAAFSIVFLFSLFLPILRERGIVVDDILTNDTNLFSLFSANDEITETIFLEDKFLFDSTDDWNNLFKRIEQQVVFVKKKDIKLSFGENK
jgi:hypothetical protein